MAFAGFMFYIFAAICVACAVMVITSRNPVHSVLFLILAFFNAAGLFVLIGAEFLAMILVVVYVGAVAVLFLFVVMMLDVNFVELRRGVKRYVYLGATLGGILFLELALVATSWTLGPQMSSITLGPVVGTVSNTRSIGQVIYTDYVYLFQGASLILLVAMVGAIVLTLRSRAGVKKQVIADQVSRSSKDELIVVKVDSGSGI
ncbi:MAG TPA: NADH-quinone oxidoreductase subunit J [Rhodospirillaceae bacterium]|nr:NADH:ubiquinone oxidoreductase subunit J [Rhodospirillaceae bacterium]MAX61287.1 NADH:ubiquinone oxidoreductase subunit J [Rhodospirillaceae bacterium]MBB56031.1 NADH:ubiquinone oxidoreductase subunit J [Rhodospirillaceae bacterium]HAE01907.1 NADH-quinone oxidoreductase subunit J [Rhodospirillaceae bacterium]HAJ21076.1 NADH-quinone oxidoreductase subunit J [Rhodospirillaceae bacterium]|tara:strand:- start:425 stop:1033 length:609 start_codon:yes stop_codon:yes gene_type:complete